MIRMDVKRTDFYNELSKEESTAFFTQTRAKYMPNIDNIYYTVQIVEDFNGNPKLIKLFQELNDAKDIVKETHESVQFYEDLYLEARGFNIYKYCLSRIDMYDVFILDYIPNNDTPRIIVQIRSYGLWVLGWEKLLKMSYESVQGLFLRYDCVVGACYENRIDYCFHTNAITAPEKLFCDRNIVNTMSTSMERYHFTGRMQKSAKAEKRDKTVLYKDYFAIGERKSNYVFIRFYNKALEVVEKGYKSYFFEIWFRQGLINFYDKFCFEYAYKQRNFNSVHKGRLEFYMKHGSNNSVLREFKSALDDKNMKWSDYRDLADQYMPEITKVMNAEFETKRKFYYLSNDFINMLPMNQRSESLKPMARLYKIIDNRGVFLDWLTDKTLRFNKNASRASKAEPEDAAQKNKPEYADWWKRLRSAALDIKLTDDTLLRDYSHEIDLQLMKRRVVNSIAGNAVYLGKEPESGFIEDLTQDSQNSGKPEFIEGHNYGQVSAVITNGSVSRSLPLITELQASPKKIEGMKKEEGESLVSQMATLTHQAAQAMNEPVYVALDAYFSSEAAWATAGKTTTEEGIKLVEIVTRSQINMVAYTILEPSKIRKRGQPRKYGDKIVLYGSLPIHPNLRRPI